MSKQQSLEEFLNQLETDSTLLDTPIAQFALLSLFTWIVSMILKIVFRRIMKWKNKHPQKVLRNKKHTADTLFLQNAPVNDEFDVDGYSVQENNPFEDYCRNKNFGKDLTILKTILKRDNFTFKDKVALRRYFKRPTIHYEDSLIPTLNVLFFNKGLEVPDFLSFHQTEYDKYVDA